LQYTKWEAWINFRILLLFTFSSFKDLIYFLTIEIIKIKCVQQKPLVIGSLLRQVSFKILVISKLQTIKVKTIIKPCAGSFFPIGVTEQYVVYF
jgi:hypothetical protein